jgi:hypothetical protein
MSTAIAAPSVGYGLHRDRFGAETREEFLDRKKQEREQERENPARYVFQWSTITANGGTLNYDHQDDEQSPESRTT